MATIYVDGSVALERGAADRFVHLAGAGHELRLVASVAAVTEGTTWAGRHDRLPDDPPAGSWYVTSDPATCTERQAGIRTMLVGPRRDAPGPIRCDETARDLRDAVLVILAADAMA